MKISEQTNYYNCGELELASLSGFGHMFKDMLKYFRTEAAQ